MFFVPEMADSNFMNSLDTLFVDSSYAGKFVWNSKKNLSKKNRIFSKKRKGPGKKFQKNNAGKNISRYDIEDILKQKSNRTIFTAHFHLWIHGLCRPHKIEKSIKKRQGKTEKKNHKRLHKDFIKLNELELEGDKEKIADFKFKEPKSYHKTWREWLTYTVGESPVLLDSAKMFIATKQIKTYLFKHGYFNGVVKDTVIYHKRKPKAAVYFAIQPNRPYKIGCVERNIEDDRLARYVQKAIESDSIINVGELFDISKLDKERNLIQKYMLDKGYYAFNKDYIYYDVDSTLGTHQVDISMGILPPQVKISDSLNFGKHLMYYLNDINVFTDYKISSGVDSAMYKSTTLEGIKYLYNNELKIKPHVLKNAIYLEKGYKYRAKEVEATYKQLANMGIFQSVSVKFKPVEGEDNLLDVDIILTQSRKQAYSLEASGTNKAGFLGINGRYTYSNRNLFRGAEKLDFAIAGGAEAQQLLTEEESENNIGEKINPLGALNTFEFGPSLTLHIPKILFFNNSIFKKWYHTETKLVTAFNFQQRPDFTRDIAEFTFSYEGQRNAKFYHRLGLFGLSALNIRKESQEFLDKLNSLNDPVFTAAYQDHIINGSVYSINYSNQDKNHLKNVFNYKGNIDWAGNMLRGIFSIVDNNSNLVTTDANGSYLLFGTRFAQFVKSDHEFVYKQIFSDKSSSVYRLAGGAGIPLKNLKEALPFEKSFFAGGSNGLRAWKARSIGPGSYLDSAFVDRFDKNGDIHLEANFEYRFDLLDIVEGALFVDAGNVWLINPNPSKPGGNFTKDFYKEIAFGGGMGFRFDLDFFIIRLDVAMQLKDPALIEGERWLFQAKDHINGLRLQKSLDDPDYAYKDYSARINFNLGIGYPF